MVVAEARAMPTSEDAFQDYMSANPNRSESTNQQITIDHGWSPANRAISLPRSVYRRPWVDVDGLRNPVGLWLAGDGKYRPHWRGPRQRR